MERPITAEEELRLVRSIRLALRDKNPVPYEQSYANWNTGCAIFLVCVLLAVLRAGGFA